MLNEKTKKLLINASILLGAFLASCSILVAFSYLSKKSLNTGLRTAVVKTIDAYEKGEWRVGEKVDFKSQASSSAAVFKCSKVKSDKSEYYAVITRIPSITGVSPAVFICRKSQAFFAGYAIDNGKLEQIINKENSPVHIKYWENELPDILKKGGLFND